VLPAVTARASSSAFRVELEALLQGEPRAEGLREEALLGGRADEEEGARFRDHERTFAPAVPWITGKKDAIVERLVETLEDGGGHSVDLVDEKRCASFDSGEDAEQGAQIEERRALNLVKPGAEITRDELRHRGLP